VNEPNPSTSRQLKLPPYSGPRWSKPRANARESHAAAAQGPGRGGVAWGGMRMHCPARSGPGSASCSALVTLSRRTLNGRATGRAGHRSSPHRPYPLSVPCWGVVADWPYGKFHNKPSSSDTLFACPLFQNCHELLQTSFRLWSRSHFVPTLRAVLRQAGPCVFDRQMWPEMRTRLGKATLLPQCGGWGVRFRLTRTVPHCSEKSRTLKDRRPIYCLDGSAPFRSNPMPVCG
jgi:hypothetical protein